MLLRRAPKVVAYHVETVMQTQSKGLDGCRINPFPRKGEVAEAR